MEKIIVNPIIDKEAIIASEVAERMEDEGIILVYDDYKVVGSVILFQGFWILSILDVQEDYPNLSDIISKYGIFTFKYIS